jgi:hypothetical protein
MYQVKVGLFLLDCLPSGNQNADVTRAKCMSVSRCIYKGPTMTLTGGFFPNEKVHNSQKEKRKKKEFLVSLFSSSSSSTISFK